jgi:hypothetical protein
MKKEKLSVINDSCFSLHEKHGVACQRKSCDNWIQHDNGKNCVVIASKSGPKTLQEIGEIYGLTRMRICQIEKGIYQKVKEIVQGLD